MFSSSTGVFGGRESELALLRKENFRPHAQLIVVYGRRRVGKTALIEEAYKKDVMWKFEGLEGASEKTQLLQFVEQLAHYSGDANLRNRRCPGWREAFSLLAQQLKSKKVIVFFDEFQWLVQMKTRTVSLFKYFWDNAFAKYRGCRFVLCGSVSSFIVREVLKSRALYGRVDTEINLQPLGLKEIRAMLPRRSPQEVLDIAMTFGGIPQYLLELNPEYSYLQNLNEYAFTQSGYFFQEFARLFISHFSKNPHYEKVLLSLTNQTLSPERLARLSRVSPGGSFSQILEDLSLAGLIERAWPVDKPAESRLLRYRLLDEYLNFYFSFIYPHREAIQRGRFHYRTVNPRALAQWQGYAFERLCRRHALAIASHLRFSGIDYRSGSWFGSMRDPRKAAQVDLLFLRRDRVMTLCELKYGETLAGQKLVSQMDRKIALLKARFPSYGLQKVLILGKRISVRSNVRQAFDKIVFATDLIAE